MTVADSTHVEFDCAHGDVPTPLVLDESNEFTARGTYVREHGGPVLIGAPPDSHPATYAGSVRDHRMTLTVRLTDSNEVIGTFTAKFANGQSFTSKGWESHGYQRTNQGWRIVHIHYSVPPPSPVRRD